MSKRSQNIVENRTGAGRHQPLTREYLTTAEIERLMAAARKSSRYGHRDATMILIGYRHGLRASELCDLQWSQTELATGRLHVRRAKNGSPSVHPMQGDEIRALRRLQRQQDPGPHVFASDRLIRAMDRLLTESKLASLGQKSVNRPVTDVTASSRSRDDARPRSSSKKTTAFRTHRTQERTRSFPRFSASRQQRQRGLLCSSGYFH